MRTGSFFAVLRNTAGQFGAALIAVFAVNACTSTDDLIGFNDPASSIGGAVPQGGAPGSGGADGTGGASAVARVYPNLFSELLNKTEAEITQKLDADYQQLFYGDPTTESIFVPVGDDQAYVWDPRQGDVRADGFSDALLVSVELDRREEFDKLWRWADAHIIAKTGPLRGYLRWQCAVAGDACEETVLAGPHFGATTALLLAHGRWSSTDTVNYAAAAASMLEACFRVEAEAITSLGALSGLIDPERQLPRDTPYASDSASIRTAVMEPALFELWWEKTGNTQARALATNARAYLASVTHPVTGLVPDQASPDGVVAPDGDVFTASSYAFLLALALDSIWFERTDWHVHEADLLLAFFREPLASRMFATAYSTAGEPGSDVRDLLSLKAPLGASAVAATAAYRTEFVQAVWDATLDTGTSRKFGNLLYLKSLLVLSGRFRVY